MEIETKNQIVNNCEFICKLIYLRRNSKLFWTDVMIQLLR